ncbi:MAG: hypothetical protein J5932_11045 [Prevotella sp.]|nr:hypothetical protein [Prevotella sp.]
MELLLERTEKNENYTVGRLSLLNRIDDEYLAGENKDFLYDTLEPPVRQFDPKGRYILTKPTAIPEGRYAVVVTYSRKYDKWLPLLLWVDRFQDVRIQAGKTVADIEGGNIIIGMHRGDGRIVNAPNSVWNLKDMMVQAKHRGEPIFLTIKSVSE